MQTLDLTRALANAERLPAPAPDRAFFDLYGLTMIAYPAAFGWVLLAIAGIAYGVAGWRSVTFGEVLRGAGGTLLTLMIAAALLHVGNLASGAGAPVNYYDRLAAIAKLELQALMMCLAALTFAVAIAVPGRPAVAIGAALPLFLIAIAVQTLAPPAAYLIIMPLLVGGVALAATTWPGGGFGTAATIAAAALVTGLMLATGFLLIEGVGPDRPEPAALLTALCLPVIWPLVPPVKLRVLFVLGTAFALTGFAVALWVWLDPVANSVAIYSQFS
ncbi:MAG: hypothetical protein AAF205_11070 [Pseudomonadota bacterium]